MNKKNALQQLKRKRGSLLLVVILLVQTVSLVYIGANRAGLHIDEHYSYILSNSFDASRISDVPEVWNTWQDGDVFLDFLSVENGEQFAYKVVYDNNGKDAHPPFFYFILHTLCSFFPGVWSPWIGMIMNIVFILLAQVVLYKLSREWMLKALDNGAAAVNNGKNGISKTTEGSLWALLPVAIYGSMQIFVDTVLFIRMYSLMTLLTLLLIQQNYHLLVKEKKMVSLIFCGGITFLGTFTQYYFSIFAFFMAAVCCIYLLIKKQWKLLAAYAAVMLLSVAMVFVVFPAGIVQITGSSTNNIGNEVMGNLFNFSNWGISILRMSKQIVLGILGALRKNLLFTAGLVVSFGAALLILRFKKKEHSDDNRRFILKVFLLLGASVSLTIVAISHISGKFTYVRYVYNLFPLISLLGSMLLWLLTSFLKLNRRVLICGVIAIALVNTITVAKYQMCSFSFHERAEKEKIIIENCTDKPLVVLNNGRTYQPTALLHIFMSSDQMYMANYANMESMDEVLESVDCSNGVLYLVLTDQEWSSGLVGSEVMGQIIDDSQKLGSFAEIGSCDFTTAFLAYPEE